MKILVTGGTGVIGAAALPALLKAGHDVLLLSRHAERDAARFPRNVTPFSADIADAERLTAAVAGCDAVIHIAGVDEEHPPEATFERINVAGTRTVRDAAASLPVAPWFLFVSSLGANTGQSEYHRSKLAAEELMRGYVGPWLILRPGLVYGPGDETISLLLKMVRALPAVPVVNRGDQHFQPLWYRDFGAVLAQATDRRELAGRTLEVAGPDTTTTNDVLERLGRITARHPARIPVPAALAAAGTRTAEALGAVADRLARSAGFGMPINSARLQMLLEGNVIPSDRDNALETVFHLPGTRLQDGLEWLTDLVPEQTPGQGVGSVERHVYSAEIVGSPYTPDELIDLVCEHLDRFMPVDFAAEPGESGGARTGETVTGDIPGRGHIQVRLIEQGEAEATFVTTEGHPLAGVLTFAAERETPGIRFVVEVVSHPANALDWLALHTLGGLLQSQNWRSVVRRVVDASGGTSPTGVQASREKLDETELQHFAARIRELVDARKRAELQDELTRP